MSATIWIAGVGATLWLVWVSFLSKSWWWFPYLLALVMGFGAGLLLFDWPHWLNDLWWLAYGLYLIVFPLYRLSERTQREERSYRG